ILEHFQTVRVIESTNTPDLPAGLDRLSIDLITLGFAEQNEIWNALRTTHHPSLLYRVKLLAFRDRQPVELPEVVEVGTDLGRVT
ncbi:MAG TPA: Pvc16 family protein, partial [Enhygromyxa sp.]|nr:Pvc16 family protein [Enhygromyxa sp.]